jgi:hypothetical protein
VEEGCWAEGCLGEAGEYCELQPLPHERSSIDQEEDVHHLG